MFTMKANIIDKGKMGIYGIFNIINNKVYIGKAIDIHRRIKAHITNLNQKNIFQENQHLINSWHKYGRDKFKYVVIEYCNVEKLAERELHYMHLYNSVSREFGYNLRMDSSTGMICSEETRLKMKNSHKNRNFKFPELAIANGKRFSKFWKDNPDVKIAMSKKVSDKIRLYKIAQLDFDSLSIIKIFDSKSDLQQYYPDFYIQAILGCCQGTKNSYKSFKWCYLDRNTNQKVIKCKHKI